jgi:hypothetical protein
MTKPNVGDKLKIRSGLHEVMKEVLVLAVYDPPIETWWDDWGEDKMSLMDMASEEKLNEAEWFAVVENLEYAGETMAIASFEVEE